MPDTPPSRTVHQAFADVMGDVLAVRKDSRMSVGGGYNFRGIDAVMNACGPVFRQHGVYVVPTETIILADERVNGGKMRNLTIGVRWRVYGPAGDSFDGYSAGEAFDAGDKSTAKAHSVAYRTFLLQALCMPTDEPDPDSQAYNRAPETPGDRVVAAAQPHFRSLEEFNEFLVSNAGSDNPARLTEDQAAELIEILNNKKGKN